jgi:hypothetical protein
MKVEFEINEEALTIAEALSFPDEERIKFIDNEIRKILIINDGDVNACIKGIIKTAEKDELAIWIFILFFVAGECDL